MKRLLITLGLLGTLTACGTKTVYVEATTTAPPTTQPSTTEYDRFSPDENAFLSFIYYQVGTLYGTEREALELGYDVCATLRSGASMYDMEDAVATSLEPELIAAIIISAIFNLCPDQTYKAENYANYSGV